MDKSSGNNDSRDLTGCGLNEMGTPPITLNISTTTGGTFTVVVDIQNSVDTLKKLVSKKLKVAKDRICLLHRERELHDGTLKENGLMEGSKIILIPNVETGLLAQRPENTVMQALESLNDSQVNDFLSGKTPLNLSMRLGDHMMLIQLQLSTVNPSSPSHTLDKSRTNQRIATNRLVNPLTTTSLNSTASPSQILTKKFDSDRHNISIDLDSSGSSNGSCLTKSINMDASTSSTSSLESNNSMRTSGTDLNSFLSKQDFENLQNIVKSLSMSLPNNNNNNNNDATCHQTINTNTDESVNVSSCCSASTSTTIPSSSSLSSPSPSSVAAASTPTSLKTNFHTEETLMEQSPIKSLSNLVSSPIKTASIKHIPINNTFHSDAHTNLIKTDRPSFNCTDPISAKLTSCLCNRLENNNMKNCDFKYCQTRSSTIVDSAPLSNCIKTETNKKNDDIASTSTCNNSSSMMHKIVNNPIGRPKNRYQIFAPTNMLRKNILNINGSNNKCETVTVTDNTSTENTVNPTNTKTISSTVTSKSADMQSTVCSIDGPTVPIINATDSRALAEASRNLTQTLRKLSKEVFTNKVDLSEETTRKSGSGAVIESMKNHGKGIYSGTFSGTLNPALQDRYGRPKRDISTVIHILNDLLSATPHYSRGTRISFESPGSSKNVKQISTRHQSTNTTPDSCGKCTNTIKSGSCVYGECNGHRTLYPTVITATPSKQLTPSCHKIRKELHNPASCICCNNQSLRILNNNIRSAEQLITTSLNSAFTTSNDRNSCTCGAAVSVNAGNLTDMMTTTATVQQRLDKTTTICSKCSVELENNKTKCKLDQLRLVMQQRKQRREQRKLKGSPYGGRVVSSTTTTTATINQTSSTIPPIVSPNDVPSNHIVEEVDTAA